MNNSGDAAEQIVRITIEGVEVAAKITGAAACHGVALTTDRPAIVGRSGRQRQFWDGANRVLSYGVWGGNTNKHFPVLAAAK